MATLTVQNVSRAGVTPSYAACAGGGDAFTADKDVYAHVKNGSGGALTVTFNIAAAVAAIPNVPYTAVAVSVGAGAEKVIGPFPAEIFNDPATGLCSVTYSGVTSLTIGVFKVTRP